MTDENGRSLKGDLLSKLIKSSNKEIDADNEEFQPPEELFLLPLVDRPFFPSQTLPLIMSDRYWLAAVKEINQSKSRLGGLILSTATRPEDVRPDNFCLTGTLIRIHHPVRAAKKIQFIAEGLRRFQIEDWLDVKPPYHVKVRYPEFKDKESRSHFIAYAINIINTLKEMMKYNPLYSEELKFFLNRFSPNDPSPLCDFAASLISSNKQELQNILDTTKLAERMEKVLILTKKELEMVKIQAQIRQDVEAKMSEHQRKFFLKEQLKSIQKELGIAKDDKTADRELFAARLEHLILPEQVQERVDAELNKISVLESGSPEYGVTRNYLDLITALPWGIYSNDNFDLELAKKRFHAMHEGLEDIKNRLLEFIAVGSLKGTINGSIILLVGPPGVGKTSIGRSIANALDRKFFRFSVGGMRDEAEIKGHRKTYIGAMPGKLIQAIKECSTSNPVIMLDEIDKMGKNYQGDPASALLEVLDPEQNSAFLDHYLDVRYDLSKVLFVCTANTLDTIAKPLLDRMEIMYLSGYITEEKLAIATKHLWPKALQHHGVRKNQLRIGQKALRLIIEQYAREAGVRNLDKKIAQIIRKAAVKLVKKPKQKITITTDDLPNYLGLPVFSNATLQSAVGVVTGLAWTAMGGATLNIEASSIHTQSSGFKLTGQLGNVMSESAQIALSFVISNLEQFCKNVNYFENRLIHMHVPEGATPKDGPSAGITMASALISLARGQQIKKGFAMSGEITLTGQVLAVGGIREKIVAAKRAGIKKVILPESVKPSYFELPQHVTSGMQIHFVSHYDEVFALLFRNYSPRKRERC